MRIFLVLFFVIVVQNSTAQQNLPIIYANSKNVKIQDGLNYKPDYWVIFPETKPDIYFVDLPRVTSNVKFITDIDSISFTLKYGETKDFIVLLNGKDSCYTQISANYPNLKTPKKIKDGHDTIPFTLNDNRIYFKGTINGSELLNMQFDLGAAAVNVNKKSLKKIKINFDKKGNLVNSDGINETRVSSSNEFEIQGLKWTDIEIYETNNMEKYEDAIVGNSFFLDRAYKIDYDNSVLILFDKTPEIQTDYLKQNMILDNGVRPVFEAILKFENQTYKDWFLFDTGNSGNGIVGNSFLMKYSLYDKFSKMIRLGSKNFAFIPPIIISDQTISEGVIGLEKEGKNGSDYKFAGLIGNKILKRFNVIIDNREGFIYMKPNIFFDQSNNSLSKTLFVMFTFVCLIGIFFVRKLGLMNKK